LSILFLSVIDTVWKIFVLIKYKLEICGDQVEGAIKILRIQFKYIISVLLKGINIILFNKIRIFVYNTHLSISIVKAPFYSEKDKKEYIESWEAIDKSKVKLIKMEKELNIVIEEINNLKRKENNNKKNFLFFSFSSLSIELIIDILKNTFVFFNNNLNSFLFMSILLSCFIIYSKLDKFISIRYLNYSVEKKENLLKKLKLLVIILSMILIFIFFPYNLLGFANGLFLGINIIMYRYVKLILALIINIFALYININTVGIYSWRTLLSLGSIFYIFIFMFVLCNESFSILFRSFIHTYFIVNFFMIINCCFSSSFMYYENIEYVSNIKEINSVEKSKLEKDDLINAMKTDNMDIDIRKKRNLNDIDSDNPSTPPSVPLTKPLFSPPQIGGEKMDIDSYDSKYNTNENQERPAKKQKEIEKNVKTSFDEQYRYDKNTLDFLDLDFGASCIDKETGLSSNIILNDVKMRISMRWILTTAIGDDMPARQRMRLNPIPWHWGHMKIHELKKLSIEEQNVLLKQFKDMREYNEQQIIKDITLYNKIVAPAVGKSFTQDDIEDKAHAWSRILGFDEHKERVLQQCLEDFVELAPDSPENKIIKHLIIAQDTSFNDMHKVLRNWDKRIRKYSSLKEPHTRPLWTDSEPSIYRETHWKDKINDIPTIIQRTDRIVERVIADSNNPQRIARLEEHKRQLELRKQKDRERRFFKQEKK